MVFRKNWFKTFLKEERTLINLFFGTIFILLVVLFYENGVDNCAGVNSFIEYLLNEHSYCATSADCRIYPPLTSDCEMPGSCGMSLNTHTHPYYFNYIIFDYKKRSCVQECTSGCNDYTLLIPLCVNNVCDYTLP